MPTQKKKNRTLAGLSLRAGGRGISPATKSMTPGYGKQKKDETKRTPWLFTSLPTNCIYTAIWNLRNSPV